jgi:hypothetical protein
MNFRRRRGATLCPAGQRALRASNRLESLLAVVAAIGLVGCGTVAPTSAEPAIAPTQLATVRVAPTAGPASRAFGRDPSGDLVDGDGKPVLGPKSLDITRLEADAIGSDLRFQLSLVTAPPPNLVSPVEAAAYAIGLDTAGDARPEYLIALENGDDGSWAASLEDLVLGHRFEGSEFRGSIVFQERVVLVQLPLSIVGSPSRINVCAFTQAVARADGHVSAQDNVPDGDCRLGVPMLTLQ